MKHIYSIPKHRTAHVGGHVCTSTKLEFREFSAASGYAVDCAECGYPVATFCKNENDKRSIMEVRFH